MSISKEYDEGKSAVYRSSDDFLQRQLDMVGDDEKVSRRLALDIADILTGPTSGGKAQYIADCLVKNREPVELCERLIECAQRFLKANKKKKRK